MFIVFEGLDRSGKSSQSELLAKKLNAYKLNFPNRENCESGRLLDLYLKDSSVSMGNEAVHLLFSMNRWETKTQIIQKLEQGINVVCDRYAYSGVAYSAAKGLDFDWCLGADRGLLRPDIVFYIDVSAETIASRSGFGDERFERQEF